MKNKPNSIKIVFFNLSIFIILILLFELFFGYWFKKDSFGIYIRDQRNIEKKFDIIHNNNNYKYTFKRNSLGFIGEEIDAKKIKIVFEGGSTGEQLFTPPNYRLVDQFNSYFKNDKIDIKIINASKGGKTTRGYYNDFKNWFPKIKNFDPKIFIFYTGHNDASLKLPKHFDDMKRENFFDQIEDFIKNNSIIYELKVKIKNQYFGKIRTNYGLYEKDLYDDYKYINYQEAKIKFNLKNLNLEEKNLLNNFEKNLLNLDKKITETKVVPIFITQVRFNGISTKTLFLVNETLKEFCKLRNYHIIKLDEIVEGFEKNDFYDKIHTGINGSQKISKILYPYLKEILIKY
jgi:lysophospholipase L1-like esterase